MITIEPHKDYAHSFALDLLVLVDVANERNNPAYAKFLEDLSNQISSHDFETNT